MKSFITFLLFLAISITAAFAQKPLFTISAERAGVPIGEIQLELFPAIAPLHVANFKNLVASKFYDSTAFHRVIPGFMIQGGCPNSRSGPRETWGFGNPSQPTVNAEFSAVPHVRGILSAARSSNLTSATSQFFICVATASHLNGEYSVYGRVVQGMGVVDDIVASPRDSKDNPIDKIEMFITYTGEDDTKPDVPVLTTPLNNTLNITTTSQSLKWISVPNALLYKVEVSKTPDFNNIFSTKDVRTTSLTVTGLEPNTDYYWRVMANNGGYLSEPSEIFLFSTKTDATISFTQLNNFKLNQNFPNPFSSSTTISYEITTPQTVIIQVFDILGNEVALLENSFKSSGNHSLVFDGKGLTNGIYYYQLLSGAAVERKKMMLIK
jgi:peptidyl-prolyl cis-trans isomerase B (cyclophilin B)